MPTKNKIKKLLTVFLTSCTMHPALAVTCDIRAEPLSFGTYYTNNTTPNDSLSNIYYDCTGTNNNYSKVVITLNRGLSNTYNRIFFDRGNHPIFYNLYLDSQRTLIWGDGTENTAVYSAPIITDTPQVIKVYGRIFPQQKIEVGSYNAPIIASIVLQ